ncbi:C1 family peptidase [Algibacter mikhailovii]|uniref:Aminopeptidase n=1 Tax=Algibacter mikhailovii TaxID=425498 RepID=A0A918V4S7_9FLAO|nr:C1 family peptidase [Algibacter mikhailovii]GGZ68657.1 aminopeptidase [Algibacter mikhailovii]
MKNIILFLLLFTQCFYNYSQSYEFKTIVDMEATDVISQGNTGTCWSFSTSSFLESEINRLTGNFIDISEMYTVRNTYSDKSWNYIMRQGKAQFGEGGLAHDVLNSAEKYGLVPNSVFSGLNHSETIHNHSEMVVVLNTILDTYISKPSGKVSADWKEVVENILDVYLGKRIDTFTYQGKTYTPKSFLEYSKIKTTDYLTLTSFTHKPYYSKFILNIPDNFSNGSFYNLPLQELVDTVNKALQNGYTIELDCDVSEKTFSSKHGIAVIPADVKDEAVSLNKICVEKDITPSYRQKEFENQNTTDDHLMHITGIVKDQNGTIYYKVKNSWGSSSDRVTHGGYIYMSEAYFKLKTISITIHKSAISKNILKNLGI